MWRDLTVWLWFWTIFVGNREKLQVNFFVSVFLSFHLLHLIVLHMFLLHCCVCTCAASVFVCMRVCVCGCVHACVCVCMCVRVPVLHVSPQGSVCEDWTTVYCCYPLAVCQMIREMKRRMKTQTYHVSTALECSWTRQWMSPVFFFFFLTMQQRLCKSADFWYEQQEESILWGLNLLLNAPEDASANKSSLTCNIHRLERTNSD